MEKVIIDDSIVNLLGEQIDETILEECRATPTKSAVIVKSHLYDKMLVDEVPKIAQQHTPEGLVVRVN